MPSPYRQLADLQPLLTKLAVARASENIGPIVSKEVLASIQRHIPQYHDLAQKVAAQLKYTDATQKAARAVSEAARPQLSEVARAVSEAARPHLSEAARQAIESLAPKLSESAARAVRDLQLNLTRDVLRAIDGLSFPSPGLDADAAAEAAEPDASWLARLPVPVLVVLLCMWLEAIVACSSALEGMTGAAIPPSVEDAIEDFATVAAAIAYAIHLRRSR